MTDRDLTGLRGCDRGQTTQDFAVGISVFLLTVTFTFAFVPSAVTPFGSPVNDAIPEKSDRVASSIVNDFTAEDRSRVLSASDVETVLANYDGGQLRDVYGLRSTAQVNVTIQDMDGNYVTGPGGDELRAGDTYPENQAAASTTRVIRMNTAGCKTGCLLVVRVW